MANIRRYERGELLGFFEAVDQALEEPATIILIGGSAVILAYGVTTTTVDVDTLNKTTDALKLACLRAYEQTGLAPPLSQAGVAQVPECYEDRLVRHPTGGSFLALYVLERHDLAISKAFRGDDRDRQHLMAMHAAKPLDFDILVSRFRDEVMPIYVGDLRAPLAHFLWIIEELFGEMRLVKAERMLQI